MFDFLVQRAAISIVTLFVISMIVFTGVRMIPGDPARVLAGTEADAAGIEAVREKYGLGDPIPIQYLRWVALALRGDLGHSIRTRESVIHTVATKLPITMELAFLSLLIAVSIAIPAGVLAAVRRNTVWDMLASGASLGGVSIPNFWLGIMLILVLSLAAGLLPSSGFVPFSEAPLENLWYLALPTLTLASSRAAALGRLTRAAVLDVVHRPFVQFARAKGLGEGAILVRHVLPNAAIPIVTVIGLQVGYMLGGAIVVETIFALPGLGRMTLDAVLERNYPVVQSGLLVVGAMFMLVNLVTDVLYGLIDPRLRRR